MDVIDPALGPPDVQPTSVEINLVPPQAAHLRGPERMAVRDQDHGGVAVTVAGPLTRRFLQPLNFTFGQIFPWPNLGIGGSARNCPVRDG